MLASLLRDWWKPYSTIDGNFTQGLMATLPKDWWQLYPRIDGNFTQGLMATLLKDWCQLTQGLMETLLATLLDRKWQEIATNKLPSWWARYWMNYCIWRNVIPELKLISISVFIFHPQDVLFLDCMGVTHRFAFLHLEDLGARGDGGTIFHQECCDDPSTRWINWYCSLPPLKQYMNNYN